METIKEKMERYKILAETYLNEDIKVFIKDYQDTYYFADILFVGEEKMEFKCFAPEDKKDLKVTLFWAEISDFTKYNEDIKK